MLTHSRKRRAHQSGWAYRSVIFACLLTVAPTMLAGAPAPSGPRDVTSLALSHAVVIDGLIAGPDGALFGTGAWNGTTVYRIGSVGEVATFARNLQGPIHGAFDRRGNLYVSNFSGDGTISRVGPAGQATEFARVAPGPSGMTTGPDGAIYVAIFGQTAAGEGDAVYRVDAETGEAEIYVQGQGIRAPVGIAFDDGGSLYVANSREGKVLQVSPDGAVTEFARVPVPDQGPFACGHLVYSQGAFFLSGNFSHVVYYIDLRGNVRTLAGTGEAGRVDGPGDQASFAVPNGLALSEDRRRLFVASGAGQANESLRVIELPRWVREIE